MNRLKAKVATGTTHIKKGEWSQVGRKVEKNIYALTEPLREGAGLLRDAYVYSRWQSDNNDQNHAGRATQPLQVTASPGAGTPQKNVIWIMLDALRADIFDAFIQRGGMKSLTENGVYFSQAFAQGSWTYPSVFSFLTGRYPFNCGVTQLAHDGDLYVSVCADFDESCPTIFSLLRQEGYQIGSVLDGWGFTIRNTAGQEHREDRYFEENWGWRYGQNRRFMTLEEQRDATLDFISQAQADAPYMLFMRSLYTHSPYRGIFKSPEYVTALSRRRWRFRIVEGFIRGLAQFEQVYLEPLLTQLRQLGQLENTIIILCSDHGDMFWNVEDDLRADAAALRDEEVWRHQLEPYNALVRVPLLVSGAGLQGVYSERFRLLDLLPTLLDELQIAHNSRAFDGVSLHQRAERPLYADSAGYGNGGIAFQAAGPKLLMSHRLGAAAYELAAGEYETVDGRRNGRDAVRDFAAFLQQHSRHPQKTIIEAGADGAAPPTEDALLRRLKALGYI
ncbi:MAG: sulfatase-like hydrolase/transferase [Chloroflexota bacterium]